jgi:hypothetical protein
MIPILDTSGHSSRIEENLLSVLELDYIYGREDLEYNSHSSFFAPSSSCGHDLFAVCHLISGADSRVRIVHSVLLAFPDILPK